MVNQLRQLMGIELYYCISLSLMSDYSCCVPAARLPCWLQCLVPHPHPSHPLISTLSSSSCLWISLQSLHPLPQVPSTPHIGFPGMLGTDNQMQKHRKWHSSAASQLDNWQSLIESREWHHHLRLSHHLHSWGFWDTFVFHLKQNFYDFWGNK